MTGGDIFIYGNALYQVFDFFRSIYKSHRIIRAQKRENAKIDLQVFLYKLKVKRWAYQETVTPYGRTIITPGPHFWARLEESGGKINRC